MFIEMKNYEDSSCSYAGYVVGMVVVMLEKLGLHPYI